MDEITETDREEAAYYHSRQQVVPACPHDDGPHYSYYVEERDRTEWTPIAGPFVNLVTAYTQRIAIRRGGNQKTTRIIRVPSGTSVKVCGI